MPYSIFFTRTGNAIHGTYEQRNLGRAVSHVAMHQIGI